MHGKLVKTLTARSVTELKLSSLNILHPASVVRVNDFKQQNFNQSMKFQISNKNDTSKKALIQRINP